MNQTVTLDGSKLRAIAHASHSAEVTITSLAMRERLRHFSDITRMKNYLIREGEKIVDADYMQLWKDLQTAGLGSIIYGRKGKPDRFEWYYSMKKVAQAALEGTNEQVSKIVGEIKPTAKATQKGNKEKPQAKAENKPRAAAPVKVANRLVAIPLRNGSVCLEISLPADITRAELNVVSETLRHLQA